MATYQAPASPVLARFIAPLTDAYSGSQRKYDCREFDDLDFLESGISRCISAVASGRDFLQQHGDNRRREIERTLFFKALKSARRLENPASVNLNVARLMGTGSCPASISTLATATSRGVQFKGSDSLNNILIDNDLPQCDLILR